MSSSDSFEISDNGKFLVKLLQQLRACRLLLVELVRQLMNTSDKAEEFLANQNNSAKIETTAGKQANPEKPDCFKYNQFDRFMRANQRAFGAEITQPDNELLLREIWDPSKFAMKQLTDIRISGLVGLVKLLRDCSVPRFDELTVAELRILIRTEALRKGVHDLAVTEQPLDLEASFSRLWQTSEELLPQLKSVLASQQKTIEETKDSTTTFVQATVSLGAEPIFGANIDQCFDKSPLSSINNTKQQLYTDGNSTAIVEQPKEIVPKSCNRDSAKATSCFDGIALDEKEFTPTVNNGEANLYKEENNINDEDGTIKLQVYDRLLWEITTAKDELSVVATARRGASTSVVDNTISELQQLPIWVKIVLVISCSAMVITWSLYGMH